MRHALYLPPFGELADPDTLADLAELAENAGFDGLFLWDHVARPAHPDLAVTDVWTALAAIASRTQRITIGTRITPLSRLRPQLVARQTAALDHLSNGRLVLGVGLGGDDHGELARFGEVTDPRIRAAMLDESLDLLCQMWSGEPVDHHGPHFRAEGGLRFLPRPIQRPRIPVWVAAQTIHQGPLRRAARFDGLCPETTPDGLREMLAIIASHRGDLTGFEVAVSGLQHADPEPFRAAGATWWLVQFPEITTRQDVVAAIADHAGATIGRTER
ncbi:hypothetical protein GCM10027589_27660 [Actinocorallia lasiicapitis]